MNRVWAKWFVWALCGQNYRHIIRLIDWLIFFFFVPHPDALSLLVFSSMDNACPFRVWLFYLPHNLFFAFLWFSLFASCCLWAGIDLTAWFSLAHLHHRHVPVGCRWGTDRPASDYLFYLRHDFTASSLLMFDLTTCNRWLPLIFVRLVDFSLYWSTQSFHLSSDFCS